MKRSHCAAAIALVSLAGFALPALSQDAASIQQKLEQLKQQREAARQAALSAAAQKPPPPPTTPRPPPTLPPPPPPTVPRPTNTVPPPPPPPTATAQPTVSASASARPKTLAVTTPAVVAIDKLRSTRQERRHAEVDKLRQRWGDLVDDERAKAELSLHAQRAAYLQRIRGLAVTSNDPKLVESVDQLITQEDRRDAEAMNALRSGAK